MSIGSRIREARKAKKLTQESLAKAIGRTKGTIANYENGVSSPSVEDLTIIMEVLDVDANYLFSLDEKKPAISLDDGRSESEILFNMLPREAQDQLLSYMRFVRDQELEKK